MGHPFVVDGFNVLLHFSVIKNDVRIDALVFIVSIVIALWLFVSVEQSSWQGQASSDPVKQQEIPTAALPAEERADARDAAAADRVMAAFKGNRQILWRALQRDANPAVRAYVIDRLPTSSAITAQDVIKRLQRTQDAGERAAVVLILGGFSDAQLPKNMRARASGPLLRAYRDDPDPEVHSAIDWLLRHVNEHPAPQAFFQQDYPFLHSEHGASQPRAEWGLHRELTEIDRPLSSKDLRIRSWAVNTEGLTMVLISPVRPFHMGSPVDEPRRDEGEMRHLVRIPRVYAISSKEVSVEQFQRYLEQAGQRSKWLEALKQRFPRYTEKFTAWPQNPQFATVWYDAAAYCNWLSKRDGIPHDQWVYPDDIGPGMSMPPDYLHRTGYRLPTEAEWEFAARGGSDSAHFFGDGVALLDRYAWFMGNSEAHGWPVGKTKPNPFGLFDMYGNAWEWIQDRYVQYSVDLEVPRLDTEDPSLKLTDDDKRIRRGGSFSYDKQTMRSAHRGAPSGYQLNNRMDSVGFRVARTVTFESETAFVTH
jgi:formylglycine-generating enzyme required for sulfatase activity